MLILYPMTPLFLKLYHATEQGIPLIRMGLTIGVIGLPLLWCDSYLPAMTMRVAGDGVYTGAVAVIALAVSRCVIGYVLTIPLGLGIHGVWIALLIEWLLRAAALHVRFRGNKWLHLT